MPMAFCAARTWRRRQHTPIRYLFHECLDVCFLSLLSFESFDFEFNIQIPFTHILFMLRLMLRRVLLLLRSNNRLPRQLPSKLQLLRSAFFETIYLHAVFSPDPLAGEAGRKKRESGFQSTCCCSAKGHHEFFRQKVIESVKLQFFTR